MRYWKPKYKQGWYITDKQGKHIHGPYNTVLKAEMAIQFLHIENPEQYTLTYEKGVENDYE